jgi:hypothetical protein
MATNNGVNNNLNFPIINTGIRDVNGNEILAFAATASAVNYFAMQNTPTGVTPTLFVQGTDTNIPMFITAKGTGGINIEGTGTNDNAAAGYVGEYISSQILFASRTSISNATSTNLTSISLTAGDWDVWGNVYYTPSVALSGYTAWISASSATIPDNSLTSGSNATSALFNQGAIATTKIFRISVASTTTIYLSSFVQFAAGSCTQCGILEARRRR